MRYHISERREREADRRRVQQMFAARAEAAETMQAGYRVGLSAALRRWRREVGLSQRQVAHVCGVSRATVARWEDGAWPCLPDVAQMATLCSVAGDAIDRIVRI